MLVEWGANLQFLNGYGEVESVESAYWAAELEVSDLCELWAGVFSIVS